MEKKNLFSHLIIVTLFLMLFVTLKSYAFDYTITFNGTGASTSVSSVIVQNLTRGTSVTVQGGNVLTLTVSPNAVDQLSANNEGIRIYPNPMQGKSTVSFYAKQAGNTLINVFGIDGRQMIGINKNLQEGDNSFLISLPKGVYAIQVAGNEYSYAAKVISQTNLQNKPEITFTGNEKPVTSAPQKIKSAVTSMPYTEGDRLLFKGISGNYSTIVTDIPTQSKTVTFSFVDCTDADGNHYPVVKIGTQIWMVENLKTTKYRTSEAIPNVTDNTAWSILRTGAYCDYDNRVEYSAIYGKLYNWHAVHDTRNITPVGWHVPNIDEWTRLTNYLGGSDYAGQMLKDITKWTFYSGIVSTNETGFSAFPGGSRNYSSGEFYDLQYYGYLQYYGGWWSSLEYSIPYAYYVQMGYNNNSLFSGNYYKELGFSVRCVSDVTLGAGLPVINTSSVTGTTTISSISGGIIKSDGGANVTARGVCWNTSQSPIILNTKTIDGSGVGSFTSNLINLSPNTKYYVRAYATNSVGTGYGPEVSFTTTNGVTDIDGNMYNTVIIGTQTWMVENLKTTKYNDGTAIPNVTDIGAWAALSTPAYCWYNNDATTYKNMYGALYNWYATNTAKLAPTGWHIASDADWTTLENYLIANGYNYDGTTTGNKIAKSLAATTNWYSYSYTGVIGNDLTKNNTSGFTALPGGYISDNGLFGDGYDGRWWSSTEYTSESVWSRELGYNDYDLYRIDLMKSNGLSVRCVKDVLAVYTTSVSNITPTSAICGGNITSDGGANITERGVCFNTSPNPNIGNSKLVIGSGTGTFSGTVSGLIANTTYYLRAYAINSVGIAYGNEISFKTFTGIVTDIDGNVYNTIIIGTQEWMAENLKTTKYRNGDPIPNVTDGAAWSALITGAQCSYNNDAANGTKYGKLYNWYAVSDIRNIAPTGWHVPTYAEWNTLKTKEAANLRTDGYRSNDGTFELLGYYGHWWSSTKWDAYNVYTRFLNYLGLDWSYAPKECGFSVRCVKGDTLAVYTISVSNINPTSAICGGNITSDGGANITDRGVCFSISHNPTISGSKLSMGSGTGTFSNTITGLTANTTYYVRAYATNSVGTGYGSELSFKTYQANSQIVTDIDGNVYHSVTIGTQVWLVENLKTTKYNDGTSIPLITDNTAWSNLSTPAYCWYSNDAATNKNIYGALYNWYAVKTAKLAPTGWHIPTDAEWTTLSTYLGGESVAGGKLKEAGTLNWTSPNTSATNETGFSALPGGQRSSDGTFYFIGGYGIWWSSTEYNTNYAWNRNMYYYLSLVDRGSLSKKEGYSVRCIRD